MGDASRDLDEPRGLAALLDTLIPPDPQRGLPAAGEVGLGAALAARDDLRPLIESALSALDARAAERGADDFASLDAEARVEVLRAEEERDPGLLPGLLFHVFADYYQQKPVVEALGLPYRPPFPEGYALEPTDASLLEGVRRRPALYREA